MKTKIVLASASPRRKKLLRKIIDDFQIIPADIDEDPKENESVEDYVWRMAMEKGQRVANDLKHGISEAIIIAGDSTISFEGRILGKPTDEANARQMLQSFSGKEQFVLTAYSVFENDTLAAGGISANKLNFKKLQQDDIDWLISQNDWQDKAGSYAIQGAAGRYIEVEYGDYDSIVGLPVKHLQLDLVNLGIQTKAI